MALKLPYVCQFALPAEKINEKEKKPAVAQQNGAKVQGAVQDMPAKKDEAIGAAV